MARKQITTVYLERQPHREAKQRLRLAYINLIKESRRNKQVTIAMEKTQSPQEVKS
jgi:hypothetical protein